MELLVRSRSRRPLAETAGSVPTVLPLRVDQELAAETEPRGADAVEMGAQARGGEEIVVVEERDPVPARARETLVAGAARATRPSTHLHADSRIREAQRLPGRRRVGCVVDHDHLDVDVDLAECARDRLAEEARPVSRRDDDRHLAAPGPAPADLGGRRGGGGSLRWIGDPARCRKGVERFRVAEGRDDSRQLPKPPALQRRSPDDGRRRAPGAVAPQRGCKLERLPALVGARAALAVEQTQLREAPAWKAQHLRAIHPLRHQRLRTCRGWSQLGETEPGSPARERLEAGVERVAGQEQSSAADHRGRTPDHVGRPQAIGDRARILRQGDPHDAVLGLEQDPGAVAPRGPALVDPAEHAPGPVGVPAIALLEERDPRSVRSLGRDPEAIRASEPRGDVDAAQPEVGHTRPRRERQHLDLEAPLRERVLSGSHEIRLAAERKQHDRHIDTVVHARPLTSGSSLG